MIYAVCHNFIFVIIYAFLFRQMCISKIWWFTEKCFFSGLGKTSCIILISKSTSFMNCWSWNKIIWNMEICKEATSFRILLFFLLEKTNIKLYYIPTIKMFTKILNLNFQHQLFGMLLWTIKYNIVSCKLYVVQK